MIDGFVCDAIPLAVCLVYLYGENSLLRIDNIGKSFAFTLDIPSEDGKILAEQFAKDELTMQAKSFCKSYSYVTRIMREMRTRNQDSWVSAGWIAGRGN